MQNFASLAVPTTLDLGGVIATPRFNAAEVATAVGGPVRLLGVGSFGDTWRLENDDTAVKIIWDDAYPPERLDREVSGLTRVRSPHVVRLLETRTVELGGKKRAALVFEYIAGGDVAERTQRGNWPTIDEAIAALQGLLIGVRDMHATGTIHRDIKPANIALRGGAWEAPVLLDLGLARAIDETTITAYPGHLGTLRYMAPEQIAGRRARKAADLFAVGTTVRELLSRRHPFYADGKVYTFAEAVDAIERGPAPLPADVPSHVVQLLDRLVAPAEHERGSAKSSVGRLGATGTGANP